MPCCCCCSAKLIFQWPDWLQLIWLLGNKQLHYFWMHCGKFLGWEKNMQMKSRFCVHLGRMVNITFCQITLTSGVFYCFAGNVSRWYLWSLPFHASQSCINDFLLTVLYFFGQYWEARTISDQHEPMGVVLGKILASKLQQNLDISLILELKQVLQYSCVPVPECTSMFWLLWWTTIFKT